MARADPRRAVCAAADFGGAGAGASADRAAFVCVAAVGGRAGGGASIGAALAWAGGGDHRAGAARGACVIISVFMLVFLLPTCAILNYMFLHTGS